MSDTPQLTALRTLQETFTTQQIQQIANACKVILEKGGYGEVTIKIDKGHPSLISTTVTHRLEKDV